jgi:hypothetical protein
MIAVRGVYDGKIFKVLHTEPLPTVCGEVPVAIIFLGDVSAERETRQRLAEMARRMRQARDAMSPLGMSVRELVEEGRDGWRSTC